METRELQKKCFFAYNNRKPRRNLYQRFLTIVEEVGELSEALLVMDNAKPGKKTNLKKEMADVFSNLLSMSEMLNIDIETETLKKLRFLSRRK